MSIEDLGIATPEEREETAAKAVEDPAVLASLVELLNGRSRAMRQRSARTLAVVSGIKADALEEYGEDLVRALRNTEARTRVGVLQALTPMVANGYVLDNSGIELAEDALYDEENGVVRGAAFVLFCAFGARDIDSAEVVWPYLNEAIQCYHGNDEYDDMLMALLTFAQSDISAATAEALKERVEFDASNGYGTLRLRSARIVEACQAHLS